MNRILPRIGAAIVSVTVFLFAICLIADFPFGSYLVCMFLPIGYIMMTAGVQNESSQENRVAANIGLIFSAMMALSTFFTGLSFKAGSKADKWLKTLMMLHGVFFLSCFFMPMTGMFTNMSNGEAGQGGTVALLVWCVYFFPIGVLAYRHFKK